MTDYNEIFIIRTYITMEPHASKVPAGLLHSIPEAIQNNSKTSDASTGRPFQTSRISINHYEKIAKTN